MRGCWGELRIESVIMGMIFVLFLVGEGLTDLDGEM
jgi:hypothetical protein